MDEPLKLTTLYTEEQIAERIDTLADEIILRLPPDMTIIALLRGSFVFAADLIRALHKKGARPQIDFMTLSSYADGMESIGAVTIHRDIGDAVTGKDVLIIDDILESGRSLDFARGLIASREAKSIHIAVFLEKPGKLKVDMSADFVGFTIPDHFVVGYGLDFANYYRELPYIGIIQSVP